jgi:tungstate transport system substrate-binding protein
VSVDVIAVGTGQALSLGELGDVDVLLVHAPESERNFIEAGHGLARVPIMYNDFVLVGPQHDPAGISSFDQASSALAHLVAADAAFASRGDNSGTHKKEQFLWGLAGLDPTDGWEGYFSLGQGMGETLRFAEEKSSYALTDRGTFLALADRLPHIAVLLGGDSIEVNPDPELLNTYSAIAVDPGKSDQIKHELALTFIEWLVSPTVKDQISAFGIEQFGQPLFFPAIGPPDA